MESPGIWGSEEGLKLLLEHETKASRQAEF